MLQHDVVPLCVVLVPVLQMGVIPPLIAELLIHGSLVVDVVGHQVSHHAQGDWIGCLDCVRSLSAEIRSFRPDWRYQRRVLQVGHELGKR